MLKRKWVAAKLFAVVGGAGLAFGICVPKASAQTPGSFSNSNYLNRYICNEQAGTAGTANVFTAFEELFPNGTGTFIGGVMQAPISADGGAFVGTNSPTGNFCAFNLDVAGSSYSVGSDGIGVEVLSWTPATSNNAGCSTPYPTATFMSSDTFVMRIFDSRPSGAVTRTELTSDNLLNQADAGTGHCLK